MAVPLHDDRETIANLWIRPDEALARNERGEFDLMPPTVRNLHALSRFETADDLLKAAANLDDVPTVVPRIVSDEGGVRILLPGDEEFRWRAPS